MYKYNLSIASCFRDELPFLEEWIKYHLLIGIQHFYLANNDIDKAPANHLLLPYIKKGIITLVPECELAHGHWKSIPKLLNLATGKTKWLAVIDIDEFIYPQKQEFDIYNSVIKEFEQNNIGGIGIGWAIFGNCNTIFRPKLVTQNYFRRATISDPINKTHKLIVRPEYITEAKGHSFLFNKRQVVNTLFEQIIPNHEYKYKPENITWRRLKLHHYAVKSLEDFFVKVNRGNAGKFWTSNNEQFWSQYFAEFNKNDEKDMGMLFVNNLL